jgi:hypothetical protein
LSRAQASGVDEAAAEGSETVELSVAARLGVEGSGSGESLGVDGVAEGKARAMAMDRDKEGWDGCG